MSARETADVGTLAEETLRLLGALGAARSAHEHTDPVADMHPDADTDPGAAEQATGESGDAARAASCTWCPLCQVVDAVREASPDVLDHLGDSLESLAAAIRELTEHLTHPSHRRRPARPSGDDPVQTIDLAEDGPWD